MNKTELHTTFEDIRKAKEAKRNSKVVFKCMDKHGLIDQEKLEKRLVKKGLDYANQHALQINPKFKKKLENHINNLNKI